MSASVDGNGAPIASDLSWQHGKHYDGPSFILNKGKNMKHWMAVGATMVMATGLSLASGAGDMERAPGLPSGWVSEGLVAGVDEVGVDHPRDGGPAKLVIIKRGDSPAGKPLTVYQTIDATPWRGRTIVFSSYRRVHLEPEVMRRVQGTKVIELHIECDGGQPGSAAFADAGTRTRRWLEANLPVKVPDDATRCSFGVATMVKAEIRLSQVRLKDRGAEREAFLARRWPERDFQSNGNSLLPAGMAANAAAVTPPNLEFKQ